MSPNQYLCAALWGVWASVVNAAVATHGEFVASEQCAATLTLQDDNPGNVHLEPGRPYRALALDRRGGGWIRIIIPEARPRVRWADMDCGEYRADEGTLHFSPFFDSRTNLVYVDYPWKKRIDITPTPPPVSPLEERLLSICGHPGDYPEPGAFRALVESEPTLLANLGEAIGCSSSSGPDCNQLVVLDRLTDLWFLADGFRRVFCGEPGSVRIEGPHYRASYLQLQRRGWGGLMDAYKGREEVLPGVIYSIGIEHEWRGKRVQTPISQGYFYSLDGPELLIHGTRAITLLGAPMNRQACRYIVKNHEVSFNSVVIGKEGGLKTFYPTVLPDRTLLSCEP
ncbi:exported hypothetical protein [Gammaproteobacteria bacterium]